jgi:hypothetical protein
MCGGAASFGEGGNAGHARGYEVGVAGVGALVWGYFTVKF